MDIEEQEAEMEARQYEDRRNAPVNDSWVPALYMALHGVPEGTQPDERNNTE